MLGRFEEAILSTKRFNDNKKADPLGGVG